MGELLMKEKKHSGRTRYKLRLLRLMSVYAIFMLILVIAALYMFRSSPDVYVSYEQTSPDVQTEYVYVKLENSETGASESVSEQETVYTVREYMDKIGIFLQDGTLVRVLDVYVKTLPEADERLLKEGIEIIGKKQLNEIIQDYGG